MRQPEASPDLGSAEIGRLAWLGVRVGIRDRVRVRVRGRGRGRA